MSNETKLIQAIVDIACAEIGVRESGENTGRRVREYQDADTLKGTSYPWCASFVSWDLREAGKRIGVVIPWSNSASCDVVWQDAKKRNLIRNRPEPGDVFLVRARRSNGSYSQTDAIHTGLVARVEGNTFHTVEGNTNGDGGREGIGVLGHARAISDRYVFVRPIAGLKEQPAPPKPELKSTWTVTLQAPGRAPHLLNAPSFDGRPYLYTRDFAEYFGLTLDWNRREAQAVVQGYEVPVQARLVNGLSLYPVRVLAELLGYHIDADSTRRVVTVAKR